MVPNRTEMTVGLQMNVKRRTFASTLIVSANVYGALTLIAGSFVTSMTIHLARFCKNRRMFATYVTDAGNINATDFTT